MVGKEKGFYETVSLNFMFAGHTKFSPDRSFASRKKKRLSFFSKLTPWAVHPCKS